MLITAIYIQAIHMMIRCYLIKQTQVQSITYATPET